MSLSKKDKQWARNRLEDCLVARDAGVRVSKARDLFQHIAGADGMNELVEGLKPMDQLDPIAVGQQLVKIGHAILLGTEYGQQLAPKATRLSTHLDQLKGDKRPQALSLGNDDFSSPAERVCVRARIAGYVQCMSNRFGESTDVAKSYVAEEIGGDSYRGKVDRAHEVGDLDSGSKAARERRMRLEKLRLDKLHRNHFQEASRGELRLNDGVVVADNADMLKAIIAKEANGWRERGIL